MSILLEHCLKQNKTWILLHSSEELNTEQFAWLTEASKHGYRCVLAFVIQVPGVKTVLPNTETHPEFGAALQTAKDAGVEVLFLMCRIKEDEIVII